MHLSFVASIKTNFCVRNLGALISSALRSLLFVLCVSMQSYACDGFERYLSEEQKKDASFLASHGCHILDFQIRKALYRRDWVAVLRLGKELEKNGMADRYALRTQARAHLELGNIDGSIRDLEEALGKHYRCSYTRPVMSYTNYPDVIGDAILYFNISELRQLRGDVQGASFAHSRADLLIRDALRKDAFTNDEIEAWEAVLFRHNAVRGDDFLQNGECGSPNRTD